MATGQHCGAMILYFISAILDAFDGMTARYFNQCSQFGAALDMVTDRSATMMLLCALCRLYPAMMMPIFQFILSLDLSSHYVHMLSSTKSGSASHKTVAENSPILLRVYYTKRWVLFIVCAMNELFLASLYVWAVYPHSWVPKVALALSSPVFLFKQIVHVIQLVEAFQVLLHFDVADATKANK
ncbi:CDP-alcohol phosphatidyltransferase [Mitosporidium daphniae]|uniref:CDP-diacylglycerol--inositol 3-phosphatidyltransferase n=1 Tax=Mitosporidium daphniae TaxID=1485682 RepID=A0A098VTB9_9MICR|nr:CDP-alcohol phosphatidyltransferase [Mitosporidium daphniae]KGG50941.1 CDP-alcohol phosphatidyltransferase [Mitosporidium daphniae]|eukprot:XP_013237368.1 CDP-alcohol phosphatidyltransferase [Mitosporidium daphniae]